MASELSRAGYIALDKGRSRYVSPEGEEISRREALKRVRGLSLEDYQLYKAGAKDKQGYYTSVYLKARSRYAQNNTLTDTQAEHSQKWQKIAKDLFSPTYKYGTKANHKQWERKMRAILIIWGDPPDLSDLEIRDYMYIHVG